MINLSCFFSKKLFTSFIPILFLCAAGEALATNNGIAGRTGANGGATCESAACHAAGATVPTVTIDGPASVAPGSTTTYTVVITGGPAVNAGFGVAAPGATLAVTDAATTRAVTRAGNVEIVHSNPVNFAAGATNVSFPFSFTAPAAAGSGAGRLGWRTPRSLPSAAMGSSTGVSKDSHEARISAGSKPQSRANARMAKRP